MTCANYSILIADDDEEIIESVAAHLNRLARKFKDNIVIHSATSATDVLTVLASHRVDVLFLDYYFEGGISGDEIIDTLKDPFENMLVILMSGFEARALDGIIIKRHKHLGERFKFLRKPFDFIELQDKYLEIEQFFSSRPYPFPLAYAQDTLSACSTAQGKITAIKDVIETITKYSVAVLMSDLYRLGLVNELGLSINLKLNLTLGAWLSWLNKLVDYFLPKQEMALMPELILLFAKTQGNGHLDLMYEFKEQVRDIELGHGYVKEEGWYSLLVDAYLSRIEELLCECTFFSRYILLMPEKVDFSSEETNDYQVRLLMGSETKFSLTNFQSSHRLKLNEIYLFDRKERYLSLSPFVKYTVCQHCASGRLYFLDQILSKQLLYNAFCNHRFSDEKDKTIFDAKFPNLKVDR